MSKFYNTSKEHPSKQLESPSENPSETVRTRNLWQDLKKAFGPIIGGMIIDGCDLATFGPVGLVIGIGIGGLAGLWVGRLYNQPLKYQILLAIVAGIYCAIPGTGLIPFATIIGGIIRFLEMRITK